ncbi:MAG TPA: ATP-grasp domain-containing protein, partial [Gemmataceae bacterium]
MRILVYELLMAMGLGRDPSDPFHSLYREGRAMADAVADDFRRIAGAQVALADERYLNQLGECDVCLVIAPDQELAELAPSIERAGIEMLNCTEAAIRIAANKLNTGRMWEAAGVPTPRAVTLTSALGSADSPARLTKYPAVCKPIHGTGSSCLFVIDDNNGIEEVVRAADELGHGADSLLLQDWVPGQAASIAFLCGPSGLTPLIPAFQVLSDDGRCHYLGGELRIPANLAARAVKLGSRALACLPGLKGYVGVDLVFGSAADGSDDYAIEINPRLTTSYVGLRRVAQFNIAEAMLLAARGERLPEFSWKANRVRFSPDGTVAPADQV